MNNIQSFNSLMFFRKSCAIIGTGALLLQTGALHLTMLCRTLLLCAWVMRGAVSAISVLFYLARLGKTTLRQES